MCSTFICVLFKGRKGRVTKPDFYNWTWVKKLYAGIRKNYPEDFRFICLTDMPDIIGSPEIEVVPLLHPTGDWSCLTEVFRTDLGIEGNAVFMGLDTIIISDLTDISNYSGDFAWLRNPVKPGVYHDSNAVVVWSRGFGAKMWQAFDCMRSMWLGRKDVAIGYPKQSDGTPVCGWRTDLDAPSEMFIWAKLLECLCTKPDYLDDVCPGQCVDYNVEVGHNNRSRPEDHEDTRVVYFSGSLYPGHPVVPGWINQCW